MDVQDLQAALSHHQTDIGSVCGSSAHTKLLLCKVRHSHAGGVLVGDGILTEATWSVYVQMVPAYPPAGTMPLCEPAGILAWLAASLGLAGQRLPPQPREGLTWPPADYGIVPDYTSAGTMPLCWPLEAWRGSPGAAGRRLGHQLAGGAHLPTKAYNCSARLSARRHYATMLARWKPCEARPGLPAGTAARPATVRRAHLARLLLTMG